MPKIIPCFILSFVWKNPSTKTKHIIGKQILPMARPVKYNVLLLFSKKIIEKWSINIARIAKIFNSNVLNPHFSRLIYLPIPFSFNSFNILFRFCNQNRYDPSRYIKCSAHLFTFLIMAG